MLSSERRARPPRYPAGMSSTTKRSSPILPGGRHVRHGNIGGLLVPGDHHERGVPHPRRPPRLPYETPSIFVTHIPESEPPF